MSGPWRDGSKEQLKASVLQSSCYAAVHRQPTLPASIHITSIVSFNILQCYSLGFFPSFFLVMVLYANRSNAGFKYVVNVC